MAKNKHRAAAPPAAKAKAEKAAPPPAPPAAKGKGKNVEVPADPAAALNQSTMQMFSLGEEILALYGPYAVVATILEAAVFQVFPRSSILAKATPEDDAAPQSSEKKPAETTADRPALHRYFRVRHVGWDRYPSSRWVSELDCRKIRPHPSGGAAAEADREAQRAEFAKDHVRARTDRELKHDWTDAYADVIIRLNEPGLVEDDVRVVVTGERLVDVQFPNRVFKLGTPQGLRLYLAQPVQPKHCQLKLEAESVVVTLRKGKPSLWDRLEGKMPTWVPNLHYRIFASRKPELLPPTNVPALPSPDLQPEPQPAPDPPAKPSPQPTAKARADTRPATPKPEPPPSKPPTPAPASAPAQKKQGPAKQPPQAQPDAFADMPPLEPYPAEAAGKRGPAAKSAATAPASAFAATAPPSPQPARAQPASAKPAPEKEKEKEKDTPKPLPTAVPAPKHAGPALPPKPEPAEGRKRGGRGTPVSAPLPERPKAPEPAGVKPAAEKEKEKERKPATPVPSAAPPPAPPAPASAPAPLPRQPQQPQPAPQPAPARTLPPPADPPRKARSPDPLELHDSASDSETAHRGSPRYSGSESSTVTEEKGEAFDVSRLVGIGIGAADIAEPFQPSAAVLPRREDAGRIVPDEDPIVSPAFAGSNRFGLLPNSPSASPKAGIIGSSIRKLATPPVPESGPNLLRPFSAEANPPGQKTWAQLAAQPSHFSLFSSSPPSQPSPISESHPALARRGTPPSQPAPKPAPAPNPAPSRRGKRAPVPEEEDPAEGMASPCLLCVGDLRCVAMVPCGHLLSCVFCAPRLEGGPCPACRRRVEGTLRIFPV